MLIFLKMMIILMVLDQVPIIMTRKILALRQVKYQRGCSISGQKLRDSHKGTETLTKILSPTLDQEAIRFQI